MSHHARPVNARFMTPGVMVLLVLMAAGAAAVLARFVGGIGYVSNLTTARPWGIWIGVDVASGVALARRRVHHRLFGPHPEPTVLRAHRAAGVAHRHAGIHLRGHRAFGGHRPGPGPSGSP